MGASEPEFFSGLCSSSVTAELALMTVTLSLLTGRHRFYDNFESMLGFRINPWIGWCWCFLAPIFCSVSFLIQYIDVKCISLIVANTTS